MKGADDEEVPGPSGTNRWVVRRRRSPAGAPSSSRPTHRPAARAPVRCYLATIGNLEQALTIQPEGERQWTVVADPEHESVNAMYGGWTLAVMLRAVEEASADRNATPTSISASFVARIEPGSAVRISARELGGTRSVSHWLAEMTPRDAERVLAVASAVFSADRPSDGHVEVTVPHGPDPESLDVFHPPNRQGEQVVLRPITGLPPFGRPDTYSTAWIRDLGHRPVDHLQLAYLADQRAPRSFYWSDGPRASATMTMSVYFHATREELAAVGDDYLLSEAFGVKGARSTSEEHHRLWSRQGSLLATSEQLARYR
jgi:acyl-CoA thioesterase